MSILQLNSNSKNSSQEVKKTQNDPLKAKYERVRKQKSYKMKAITLYEYTPKNYLDPLQLKKSLYGSQKGSKCTLPQEKQKNHKVRKRKVLQNESYQFSLLNPKTLLGAHPNCKTCLIGPKKNQKARKLKKITI